MMDRDERIVESQALLKAADGLHAGMQPPPEVLYAMIGSMAKCIAELMQRELMRGD